MLIDVTVEEGPTFVTDLSKAERLRNLPMPVGWLAVISTGASLSVGCVL